MGAVQPAAMPPSSVLESPHFESPVLEPPVMERAVNRPKHAHQALCTPKRVILLGLLFIVIAAAIAVPLGVVYGRRSRGAMSVSVRP